MHLVPLGACARARVFDIVHVCCKMKRSLELEDVGDERSIRVPVRTDRKFCKHCNEMVSLKTYQYHRRLYFDQV